MPSILDGYCSKSDKPREEAEAEAKEFLQVIEDSASYQFGYNHSIAYCLLGYLCAYFRYYYPYEFITSFLNNAANDADIINGTAYAHKRKIKITMPKWGASRSGYYFNKEDGVIAKGLASVKYIGGKLADELYETAQTHKCERFIDVLYALMGTSIDTRQLDILIKIDFFSEFGNQRELLRITELFNEYFKQGTAKKIQRDKIDGTPLEPIVKKYAVGVTKAGAEAKSYTLLDIDSILRESEDAIKAVGMEDLSVVLKARNFNDIMGYMGFISGKHEDRPKLYIINIYELKRKKDGKQFGYSFVTRSIGSGKESRFTVFNKTFETCGAVKKDDLIECLKYERDGEYFKMTSYRKLM